MLPLVSIIIPTKNSAEFLEDCLESVKNQFPLYDKGLGGANRHLPLSKRGLGGFRRRDLEIIVIDNFSEDDTMEIAKIK